jgi:hypothetical protein
MDFFVAVPTSEAGRIVAARAVPLGFSTIVELDEETGSWTCSCTKILVPSLSTLVAIEVELDRLRRMSEATLTALGRLGTPSPKETSTVVRNC